MPLYDFQCSNCNETSEVFTSISDSQNDTTCPACGQLSFRKTFLTTPTIVSGVNLAAKVPHGFRDVLKRIKAKNPHNKIDGELS